METEASAGDSSVGLGLVFSILAVGAALAMAVFGYQSAVASGDGGGAQLLSGVAFGVAMLTGVVAIVAVHVYAE